MASHGEDGTVVRVGAVVRIRGHEGVEQDVTLVATATDEGLYRLSVRTPLGRALLGRREGDEVEVHTEAGTAKFTIVGVNP